MSKRFLCLLLLSTMLFWAISPHSGAQETPTTGRQSSGYDSVTFTESEGQRVNHPELQPPSNDTLKPGETPEAKNVELVGQIGGGTYAVAVQGNYAYIGVGPRLVILNIADPVRPMAVAQTRVLPDLVMGIVVVGDYAYVADASAGLRIINISNPAVPAEVGFHDTPDIAEGIVVAGRYAYIADNSSGLRIIDIVNPFAPTEVGSYDTPGTAVDIAISGNRAYVADDSGGLRIINVANPSAPAELGFYPTPGKAQGLDISGDYVYIAAGQSGLRIVNITNPSRPVEVGSLVDWPYDWAKDVLVRGYTVYLADYEVRCIDASNVAAPVEISSMVTYAASDLRLAGNYVFVAGGTSGYGLQIGDFSIPTAPTSVSQYRTFAPSGELAVANQRAYTSSGDLRPRFQEVDISRVNELPGIGVCCEDTINLDIAAAGNYAYIAADFDGFLVVDGSNPIHPNMIGRSDIEWAGGVEIANSYAYVWATVGLYVFDVSNPSAPLLMGFGGASYVDWPRDTAVTEHYGLALLMDGVLEIYDISNSHAPHEVGFLDLEGAGLSYPVAIAATENYAYIADVYKGLIAVDISNPSAPVVVHNSQLPDGASGVAISGHYLYVGARANGLRVLDISNPIIPVEVGSYDTPGYARQVVLSDGLAYVKNGDLGLYVLRFGMAPTTYAISGRVTDAGGHGIGSVTISVGGAHSATTDSNGVYLISGLGAGTHTITPSKSSYDFSPASRTVTLPPSAERQDFTASLSPLATSIQTFASDTNGWLNQVLAEAGHSAQDGDYFAVQRQADEIGLVADMMLDAVDIVGARFDTVEKAKDLVKMDAPGVTGSGWGHVIDLRDQYEPARDAFREALFVAPLTGETAQYIAREHLRGAAIYYAADALDSAAENLVTDGAIKYGLQVGLQSNLGLQNRSYPALMRLSGIYQQDTTSTAAATIAQLPILSSDEEQAYTTDLRLRNHANAILASAIERRALPLHLAHDARESEPTGAVPWLTSFLGKYFIRSAAGLCCDGPGVVAVEAGVAVTDFYQNSQRLKEDERMMTLGAETMRGAWDTSVKIYLNTVNGLDNVAARVPPQIPDAAITSITNKSVGEYKLFHRWIWWERSAYSEVKLHNRTTFNTDLQVIADYGNTGLMGTSYQPLYQEGFTSVAGGQDGLASVRYNIDGYGASPDKNSNIPLSVLGSTDTGTYFVQNDGTTWDPIRVSDTLQAAASGSRPTAQQAEDAPTIAYPIRSAVEVRDDSLSYVPHLWIDNPFTETLAVTITQPLPTDVQILNANGGVQVGNNLTWSRTIPPQASVEITHIVAFGGQAGAMIEYPGARLEMSDATASAMFTSNASDFRTLTPLVGEARPPRRVLVNEEVDVPITITNRSGVPVPGAIRLTLKRTDGTLVHEESAEVLVPALDTVVRLLAFNVPPEEGLYVLHASVESGGGIYEILTGYLKVTRLCKVYLPSALRGSGWQ